MTTTTSAAPLESRADPEPDHPGTTTPTPALTLDQEAGHRSWARRLFGVKARHDHAWVCTGHCGSGWSTYQCTTCGATDIG